MAAAGASEILIFVAKKVNWNKVQDLLRISVKTLDFHPKVVLVKKNKALSCFKILIKDKYICIGTYIIY